MKKLGILLVMFVMLVVGPGVLWCPAVVARDPICDEKDLIVGSDAYKAAGCAEDDGMGLFERVPGVVSAVIWLAGIVAVGMIIFGGVKYSTSQGDPGKVKSAKDTILYALIGLVVAILSFVIIAFVLEAIA